MKRASTIDHHRSSLTTCVLCGRDFVTPVRWEPVGVDRWWIFVRCGDCGTSREVTVSNAEAERYDEELVVGQKAIWTAADALEHERLEAEVAVFASALAEGLIEASDFER